MASSVPVDPVIRLSKEEVVFVLPPAGILPTSDPVDTLTLTNTSSKWVGFKVRTTNPKRYMAKPSLGCIPAGSTANVHVVMLSATAPATEAEAAAARDRFQVQSVAISEEKDAGHLNSLWTELSALHKPKEGQFAFHQYVLHCRIDFSATLTPIPPTATAPETFMPLSAVSSSSLPTPSSSTLPLPTGTPTVMVPSPSGPPIGESSPSKDLHEKIEKPAVSPLVRSGPGLSSVISTSKTTTPRSKSPPVPDLKKIDKSSPDPPIPSILEEKKSPVPILTSGDSDKDLTDRTETDPERAKHSRKGSTENLQVPRAEYEEMVRKITDYEQVVHHSVELTITREKLENLVKSLQLENEELKSRLNATNRLVEQLRNRPRITDEKEASTAPLDRQSSARQRGAKRFEDVKSSGKLEFAEASMEDDDRDFQGSGQRTNQGISFWVIALTILVSFVLGKLL